MGPLTMDTIFDLIEEAKLRFLWWSLCIFAISYFLTHTSKSMWMNIPISILFFAGLRILVNKVEFRWKVQSPKLQTYLSHLEKKQLSLDDERVSTSLPPPKWKKKIDSPAVEAALNDFIDLILKDFVINMWYADITSDGEFPEQIRDLIMDALAEVTVRVKEINIVDLLTSDIVDLISDHIDLFRRNQAAIGVDVMLTLSSEERDERLKFHLLNSKELHPALISPESEYKVLQRLISGVLATVLRKPEAQVPVVRSIAREIMTCLILQPLMNLACPAYINELIESLLLVLNVGDINWLGGGDQSSNATTHNHINHAAASADWAQMLDAATQRRTEVLTPENLENMWARGRNYGKKSRKNAKAGSCTKHSSADQSIFDKHFTHETSVTKPGGLHTVGSDPTLYNVIAAALESSADNGKNLSFEGDHQQIDEVSDIRDLGSNKHKLPLRRTESTSVLGTHSHKGGLNVSECNSPDFKKREGFRGKTGSDMGIPSHKGGFNVSECNSPDFKKREGFRGKTGSDMVIRKEGQGVPKLRCRVMGAYFEKLGATSFAVYSIAVTDGQEKTWFVKRRYRNFERLHRHLKHIPNYTLHLPPKRIFSSSTEDAFVHQRCIQLDKYLHDLLSIANVAEQHEVWDFLSVSSKNYSFGKSSSMMRTLAVNVDDAVDDIVRQFKGVSDDLKRKVVTASSPPAEGSSTSFTWNMDEMDSSLSRKCGVDSMLSSDNEEGEKESNHGCENIDREVGEDSAGHSENELSSKDYSQGVTNHGNGSSNLDLDRKQDVPTTNGNLIHDIPDDPIGVPPEWTPPNVSVPILNLVDNIFQLKKRGWLRRQVFWISKQILQLVMEDAIDDLLLSEIHWLRREETIVQGIRWVQDILWPGGTFFLRVQTPQLFIGGGVIDQKPLQSESGESNMRKSQSGGYFEEQLEAARRASDVKKLLFDGAPAALVSLIGQKQYKRCASDIYYFSQSSVCVKQLAYAILELLLISIFPELRNVVMSVHENMHVHQPV
ncbi:uncharacterized protein LOC131634811 [Vicia villosa]|uniref:uncharacterized protein LOC131634811 n=1 Tax=Vicia villosa TaxID=3911 RepID=UPI00273CDFB9|nr:uncharacterized protein LOC131634811 [Vicia villosa]